MYISCRSRLRYIMRVYLRTCSVHIKRTWLRSLSGTRRVFLELLVSLRMQLIVSQVWRSFRAGLVSYPNLPFLGVQTERGFGRKMMRIQRKIACGMMQNG